MFEDLTLKLETSLKKLTGQGRLSEKNISDTLRDIRRVLLDADVNYRVAKDFIDNVTQKSLLRNAGTKNFTSGRLFRRPRTGGSLG